MDKRELQALIALKLRIEELKPLYSQYDELLQKALNHDNLPRQVAFDGRLFELEMVNNFALKNNAWKSVSIRQFDLSITPVSHRIKETSSKRVEKLVKRVSKKVDLNKGKSKGSSIFKTRRR